MSEMRTCASCGGEYYLPVSYEEANPRIRDLCFACIEEMTIQEVEKSV